MKEVGKEHEKRRKRRKGKRIRLMLRTELSHDDQPDHQRYLTR